MTLLLAAAVILLLTGSSLVLWAIVETDRDQETPARREAPVPLPDEHRHAA